MVDEVDRANQEVENQMALQLASMKVERKVSVDCVECGEYIPQARQQILGGTDLCVHCAELQETI